MVKTAVLSGLVLAVSACTWVKTDAASSGVEVSKASAVTDCRRLGIARVKTLSRIVFIPRSSSKVKYELETLAKREAAVMGGNVVVADSLADGGEQVFGVYRCEG